MVLRQSVKLILAAYGAWGFVEIAILTVWASTKPEFPVLYLLAVPIAFQLWAAARHISRLSTKLTIAGDRLRYESGILSKTSRVMELAKVQDVRVDQRLMQRMLNVGDLSLETAGETSRITMPSIDRPQEAADHILSLSRDQRQGQSQSGPR